MFDISWTELLIVVVVAVVVVGPKDLPRLMRVAGQWVGRARAMADQFRRSFEDMARQAELEEMRAEVMKAYDKKTLDEIHRETDVMLGYLPPDAPPDAVPNIPNHIRPPEVAEAASAAPAPGETSAAEPAAQQQPAAEAKPSSPPGAGGGNA